MGILTDRAQQATGIFNTRLNRHNDLVRALLNMEQMRSSLAALSTTDRNNLKAAIDAQYGTGIGDEIQTELASWQQVVDLARTNGLLTEIKPPTFP
jgi:hypothetical protein